MLRGDFGAADPLYSVLGDSGCRCWTSLSSAAARWARSRPTWRASVACPRSSSNASRSRSRCRGPSTSTRTSCASCSRRRSRERSNRRPASGTAARSTAPTPADPGARLANRQALRLGTALPLLPAHHGGPAAPGIGTHPSVALRTGVEVTELTQDADGVTVTTHDIATGRSEEVRARYVIGADGASSTIRTGMGAALTGSDFDEPWLVVDLLCERGARPPNESEMFCDPARPATRSPALATITAGSSCCCRRAGRGPAERAGHRRLLSPWVKLDEVEILRASVYRFHSLLATRWPTAGSSWPATRLTRRHPSSARVCVTASATYTTC